MMQHYHRCSCIYFAPKKTWTLAVLTLPLHVLRSELYMHVKVHLRRNLWVMWTVGQVNPPWPLGNHSYPSSNLKQNAGSLGFMKFWVTTWTSQLHNVKNSSLPRNWRVQEASFAWQLRSGWSCNRHALLWDNNWNYWQLIQRYTKAYSFP